MMAELFASAILIASVLALVETFLLGCQSWEHLRRARFRISLKSESAPAGRVALIAPCKGLEPGLRENLRALFHQDYPHYQLVFVAESADDPACNVIRRLISEHPAHEARLVLAGATDEGCQKVRNLSAAADAVGDEVEVLAFVDSDARPRPSWLRRLVERLDAEGVGAVTGYRWFVPRRFSLSSAMLCSINGAAASLYSPKTFQPVWGGSWAIRRRVFRQLELARQWQGRLTDDLVATNVVRAAGLRVEFEPRCMVASPLDCSWPSMFAFLRRQYVIGRLYARRWWWGALAATSLTVIGFWGGVGLAVAGAIAGRSWAWAPAAACVAWYAVNWGRAAIRSKLSQLYLPELQNGLEAVNRFDAWATPVTALVNWAAIVSSATASRIAWRGVQYRLLAGGRAVVVRPQAAPPETDARPFPRIYRETAEPAPRGGAVVGDGAVVRARAA
jgi:hypothetical protein